MKVDGEGLVADIRKALGSDSTFFFQEYLTSCSVLTDTPHEPYLHLLQIYCTGTFRDYERSRASLPQLSEDEITKLRILTIVRMSVGSRVLKYSEMLSETGLTDSRDLEQVIIQSVQQGILDCKIDEANQQVFVTQLSGRDVTPQDCEVMLGALTEWSESCQNSMQNMQTDINASTAKMNSSKKETEAFKSAVQSAKTAATKDKPLRESSSAKSRKRLM